jgi:Flp pilus assembly protein TadB
MDVLVIVLWVSIGYFVLLILIRLFRLIFGSKEARNLAKISKQLDITNDYLAQVVHLFKHDKGKEKTDVKGKKKKGKR